MPCPYKTMPIIELNLDALVGPTHNYAGLAYGNLASQTWGGTTSNPRAAALEGLEKMKLLADLGVPQAVLPPQERPDVDALRRLGFHGSDARVLEDAHRADPALLAACCSASSMWAANAATISPSDDCADGLVHITPANLLSQFHRSIETSTTADILRAIFNSPDHFVHHAPLPSARQLADEGAANHMRLCGADGGAGVEVFVHGRKAFDRSSPLPARYPARQTWEASAAIARLHRLDPSATVFLAQNPAAVDMGVFHNDVGAVGHRQLLLCHASAFADGPSAIETMRQRYRETCRAELTVAVAEEREFPLADAVTSYLFNSQLVTLADGGISLIAPSECEQSPAAVAFIQRLLAAGTIASVHYVHVRQSMRNGGGPACLRLRAPLTAGQLAAVRSSVLLTPALYDQLKSWIARHYRERLAPADLADPLLLSESRAALEELTRILRLDRLYPFQRSPAASSD